MSIRTLIADDDPDMRLLMRVTLGIDGRCEVVGEAADGDQALALWASFRPDVVVLDQRMPALSGLEVARAILAENPRQVVIICSAYVDDAEKDQAHRLGVFACLDKGDVGMLADTVRDAVG